MRKLLYKYLDDQRLAIEKSLLTQNQNFGKSLVDLGRLQENLIKGLSSTQSGLIDQLLQAITMLSEEMTRSVAKGVSEGEDEVVPKPKTDKPQRLTSFSDLGKKQH
jgi:hypothetical protein